ncbi:MAG: alpha-ribazole phosphatase [Sporomusaceae bacterium]|nr:alpha-ribazole phosphatase [Sporomusaceae bacterium]
MQQTVFLIRHGQTDWNTGGKYMGHSDIPLNGAGLRQAEALARRLAGEAIGAVVSSDLARSRETAALIAAAHGLPVQQHSGLREIDFGQWEGLSYAEIMRDWPALLPRLYENPGRLRPPGGESALEVRRRAVAALTAVLKAAPQRNVAVVTHGGPIRLLLCHALALPAQRMWRLEQDAAAVNILRHQAGAWTLAVWNDTSHLR